MFVRKCHICNTVFDWDETDDECTYCNWLNSLSDEITDEDDEDNNNPLTARQARKNLAHGLDIWGKPLPRISA